MRIFSILLFVFVVTGCQNNQLYHQAENARCLGAPNTEALLKQVIEDNPDSRKAHVSYQKFLYHKQRQTEAVKFYKAKLDQDRDATNLWLYARVLHAPAQEELLYREALTMAPKDSEIREALAYCLKRQFRLSEAIKVLSGVIKNNPDNLNLYAKLHRLHANSGTLQKLLEKYQETKERDGRFWYAYGNALKVAHKFKESEVAQRKALKFLPGNHYVRLDLAACHMYKVPMDTDAALDAYHKILEEDPQNPFATTYVAFITTLLTNSPSAKEDRERAIRLEPESSRIYTLVALAKAKSLNVKGAISSWKKSLSLDPSDDEALLEIAGFMRELNMDAQAEVYLNKLVKAAPGLSSSYQAMAVLMSKNGRTKEEKFWLEKAEKLQTNSRTMNISLVDDTISTESAKANRIQILVNHAMILASNRKYLQAEKKFEEAVRLDPKFWPAYLLHARVLYKQGKTAVALKLFQTICQNSNLEENPETLLLSKLCSADCYYKLGNLPKSLEHYKWVSKNYLGKLSQRYAVKKIVEAIEANPEGKMVTIKGMPETGCMTQNSCVPYALYLTLKKWGADVDMDQLCQKLMYKNIGTSPNKAYQYSKKLEGFKATFFISRVKTLKKMVDNGIPVIICLSLPFEGKYRQHATVVRGYDERRKVFLLEDCNWFGVNDYLTYDHLDGRYCMVVYPENMSDQMPQLDRQQYANRVIVQTDGMGSNLTPEEAKIMEKLAAVYKDDTDLEFRLAEYYYFQTQYKKTYAHLKNLIPNSKTDPRPWVMLAAITLRNDLKKGMNYLFKAIELEPDYTQSYRMLVNVYVNSNGVTLKKEGVKRFCSRILANDKLNPSNLLLCAKAFAKAQSPEEALKCLKQIFLTKANPAGYMGVAECALKCNDYDLAIKAMNRFKSTLSDPQKIKQLEQKIIKLEANKTEASQ